MFAIQIEHIDLSKIYGSIQALRWFKIHKGKYIIPSRDKCVCIEQNRNWLKLTCTEDEFWNYWYNYFDMNFDYEKSYYDMRSCNNQFKKAAVVSKGFRMLNMDPFESLLVNILLETENASEVKILLQNILLICGKRKRNTFEGSPKYWYIFPSAKEILDKKEKLTFFKLDIQKENILSACMFVENGTLDFDDLKSIGYKDTMKKLRELNIMNAKTANSFCLYGLGMKEAFPITNRFEDIMETENVSINDFNKIYNIRGLANKCFTYFGNNVLKFEKNFLKKYLQKEIYKL